MLTHSDYCEEYMTHIFPAVTLDRGRLAKRVTHHSCGRLDCDLLDQVAPLPNQDRVELARATYEVSPEVEAHVNARIAEVRRQIFGAP